MRSNRKKTTDEFKREIYNLVGDEYTVLGEYVQAHTKVLMKHNICGYEYMTTSGNFISKGRRCPKCGKEHSIKNRTKTQEQFVKDITDLVGDEYTVLGEYINSDTKILIRHNKCGHEYRLTPSNFISGRRCPKCMRPNYNRDTKHFENEVTEKVGEEYSVLGEYTGANDKILMKHNTCGHKYAVTPANFLSGKRCPKCSRFKTTEEFKEDINRLTGEDYKLIGEYKDEFSKVRMKHKVCSHEYLVSPKDFISGSRCPKCGGQYHRSTEDFKKEVVDLVGDKYSVLGEFKGVHNKIGIRHNECGNVYEVTPINFLKGSRCPKCSYKALGIKKTKTTEQFKKEVFELVGTEYEVLGEYVKSSTKIRLRHNVCGREYEATPNYFLQGNRCPHCIMSQGEKKVEDILKGYEVVYKKQFKFEDCKNLRPLPFDFAVFKNDELICLIEYDGRQHFQPVSVMGGEEEYQKIVVNDKIKNKYCEENNIPLIRISYKDKNRMKKILEKELMNLNIIK